MRMIVAHQGRPVDLSRKEMAGLDCVARGMTSTEGAARLGISRSTFAKHLANARAKLGVARTVEADAHCVGQRLIGPAIPVDPVGQDTDKTTARAIEDLAGDLAPCLSFHQAWAVMTRHAGRIGAASVHFAVLAGPKGQFANGGVCCR